MKLYYTGLEMKVSGEGGGARKTKACGSVHNPQVVTGLREMHEDSHVHT